MQPLIPLEMRELRQISRFIVLSFLKTLFRARKNNAFIYGYIYHFDTPAFT